MRAYRDHVQQLRQDRHEHRIATVDDAVLNALNYAIDHWGGSAKLTDEVGSLFTLCR